jgi:hypothetical protein
MSQLPGDSTSIHCERCGDELFIGRKWINNNIYFPMIWVFSFRWHKFTIESYQYSFKGQTSILCYDCQNVLEREKEQTDNEIRRLSRETEIKAYQERIKQWEESH